MTRDATSSAASASGWRCSSAGRRSYLWDADGRRYLDFLAGIAVDSLGHAHPAFVEAIDRRRRRSAHVSNYFATPPQLELAARLKRLAGTGDERPRVLRQLGRRGQRGRVQAAAARCTARGRRPRILALKDAFHGRTMGTLALTGKPWMQEPFLPDDPRRGVHRLDGRGSRGRDRRSRRGAVRRARQGRGRGHRRCPRAILAGRARSPRATAPC